LLHEKGLCFLNLHLQGFCCRTLLSSWWLSSPLC
jgi:hypothetical protein